MKLGDPGSDARTENHTRRSYSRPLIDLKLILSAAQLIWHFTMPSNWIYDLLTEYRTYGVLGAPFFVRYRFRANKSYAYMRPLK